MCRSSVQERIIPASDRVQLTGSLDPTCPTPTRMRQRARSLPSLRRTHLVILRRPVIIHSQARRPSDQVQDPVEPQQSRIKVFLGELCEMSFHLA